MWSSSAKQQQQLQQQQQQQTNNDSIKRPSKDDLHHWSIYRQNLNAALTNNHSSSSTINSSSQNNDHLTLKQETVDNILSSTDFKNKSSDADHYLKYGLPRVKNPIEENRNLKIEEQLAGKVKNQIKLFNEKQNELSSKIDRRTTGKMIQKNSNQHEDNLKKDLNEIKDNKNGNRSQVNSKENSKVNSKVNSRENSNDNSRETSKVNSKNSSKNQLSNYRSNLDLLSNSLRTKQWKSNPNIQDELLSVTESYLAKQLRIKQSLSEYDVRRRFSDDTTNIQNRLEQFRKYQNDQQQNQDQINANKSDDDSLTKSLASKSLASKSSPCDELDYRKSSLNEDDLSFEHNKLPKYAKTTNGLQSSDSEFVLSLDSTKCSKTKQPHLIVNKLYHEFDSTSNLSLLCGGPRQKIRVLDNISFECKPGDMLALIATNQLESSTILDIMMNQHSRTRTRTVTEFYLNGQLVDEMKLSKYCAYVGPNSNLCDQMSTRQTILFYNLLQSTNKEQNTFDSKKRIDALIEELALAEVKHTCVGDLSESEKIRLQIAIALLLDTDILLIDQPIRSMDVFDSYFILDYIRQWTLMSGKIAILALQPISYETLSLFSKVSFISTGRTVYFGDRSKMNVYFTYADYPCPSFKNPADYYLDLITVDYLSSSAMLESNHRIETLIQVYQKGKKQFKKRKPSSTSHLTLPDIKRKSFVIDFLSLWIRAMIFCFPYNVINLAKRLLLAISLSLICGCIFFKMRLGREQEDVFDRFGFYHTLLAIFSIPLFLHEIKELHHEKKHVLEELRLKVYSKEAYFLSYLIYTFPGTSIIYLGFALPASSIAIQKPDLIYYIIIMLCYLHVIRLFAIAVSWCFSTKIRSCIAFGFVYFLLVMISGNNLHEKNLNIVSRLIHNLSIYTYTYESLINWEFDNSNNVTRSNSHYHLINQRFLCSGNPLVEHNALVARAECGIQNKNHIIEYLSLNNLFTNWSQPAIIYATYSSVLLFIWYCILCVLSSNNSHLQQAQAKLKETSSFKKRCCRPEYL